MWNLTLSVPAGTLTLSSTAGLTGSGDGTGSLSYSGPLAALERGARGYDLQPAAGPHGITTLTLDAQSDGAPPLQAQFVITDGVFVVTPRPTPAPARSARRSSTPIPAGPDGHDRFRDPRHGRPDHRTHLSPASDHGLGAHRRHHSARLCRHAADCARRPVAGELGPAGRLGRECHHSWPGHLSGVTIDATADERLIAVVAAQGATSQLSLLDAQGHVLVQSDGVSSDNPDHVIDEHLAAGDYSLALDSSGGQGASTWTTMLTPATAPFQPIPVGAPSLGSGNACPIVAGDFNGDGQLDLAVSRLRWRAGTARATATAHSSPRERSRQDMKRHRGGGLQR